MNSASGKVQGISNSNMGSQSSFEGTENEQSEGRAQEDASPSLRPSQLSDALDDSHAGDARTMSLAQLDLILAEVLLFGGKKPKRFSSAELNSCKIDRSQFFCIVATVGAARDKSLRRTEPKDSLERLLEEDMKFLFENSKMIGDHTFIQDSLFEGAVNDLLHVNKVSIKALFEQMTGGGKANKDLNKDIPTKPNIHRPFTFKTAKALTNTIFQADDAVLHETFKRCKRLIANSSELEEKTPVVNSHSVLSYAEFVIFLCMTARHILPTKLVLADMARTPPKGYVGTTEERLLIFLRKLFANYNLAINYPPEREDDELAVEFSDDTAYDSDPGAGFSAAGQQAQAAAEEARRKAEKKSPGKQEEK